MPDRDSSRLEEMSGILRLPLKGVIGDFRKPEEMQTKLQADNAKK
jgi:hypothetical protein